MKTIVLSIIMLLGLVGSAFAVSSGGVSVRHINVLSPVLVWQYNELVASSVKGIKGVQINNMSAQDIKLAFGDAGSEVDQMIVGGLQDTAYMPLEAGYGTRLSVIALDGPAETGEIDLNVFYN